MIPIYQHIQMYMYMRISVYHNTYVACMYSVHVRCCEKLKKTYCAVHAGEFNYVINTYSPMCNNIP